MKKIWAMALAVALMAPMAALAGGDTAAMASEKLKKGQARAELTIEGMTCGGCCTKVETAVKALDGVVDVKADYQHGAATVTYEKKKVDVDTIVATINEKTSFKASVPAKKMS